MSSIDYSEKIPNNVNLSEDRTLQRALLSYGVESEKKLSRQKQAATVAAE